MSKDTKPLTPYEQREITGITQQAYTRALADLSKALVSIVKRVAWLPRAESPEPLCPWCGVYKSGGHAEDCDRQAALKLAEELMPFDWDEHYEAYLKEIADA